MDSPTIIGIDILPQESVSSSREPHYAAVILKNDKIIEKFNCISLRELISLAEKYSPVIIATDNVFELAKDFNDLVSLLSKFKHPPKILQVTRIKDEIKPLEQIAREFNLITTGKMNPLTTAEVVAKLASLNIGSYVEVFEQETKIIIARGRSLGQGGMSTERYKRNIQSLILRVTKKIKETLDKHGFDYDLFFRKSEYGLDRSTFIVYAPREKLYGIIKQMKGHDLQVIIKPVTKNRMEYVPASAPFKKTQLETPQRYLMVGVDPGIVTGVAVLNLNGYPITVFSKRELSRNQLIKKLSELGKVVLVATDVNPAPVYVKKLASSLNAVLFIPPYNLSVEEKRKIVQEYQEKFANLRISNTHQRDALAAVIKAYQSFKPKFERLEKRLRELCIEIPMNEAKVLIIRGKTFKEIVDSISSRIAIKQALETKKEISTEDLYERYIRQVEALKGRVEELEKIVRELKYENKSLRERVKELEEENWNLKKRIIRLLEEKEKEILKDKKLLLLTENIRSLRKKNAELEISRNKLKEQIVKLKKVLDLALQNEIEEVLIVPSITPSNITVNEKIKNSIIYVQEIASSNLNTLEELGKIGIRGLIVKDSQLPPHIKNLLIKYTIPYVSEEELGNSLIKVDNRVFVRKDNIGILLAERKKQLEKIKEEMYGDLLNKIIEEYRERRKRELEKLLE